MYPITKELRELVPLMPCGGKEMTAIADRIDAEHERRMSDSRRESRLAVIRYLRGVLLDYEKGIKRVRKGDKAEVVRCKDCVHSRSAEEEAVYYCDLEAFGMMGGTAYCSLGERREVDE